MTEEKKSPDLWSEAWIDEALFRRRRRLAELTGLVEDCNIQIMAAVGEMKYIEYEIRDLMESKREAAIKEANSRVSSDSSKDTGITSSNP